MLKLGQIGLGYWGPNLLRNFQSLPGTEVRMVCDLDPGALARTLEQYPSLASTVDCESLFCDPGIDAVVVSSSASTHYSLARRALEAGKHCFVEKPISLRVEHAEELARLAEDHDLVLMVGHLLLYHPAVTHLKALVDSGELGEVYYLFTERRNLGKVRRDENAMWSFAPHDISVVLYLLGELPIEISAQGQDFLQPGIEDVVFFNLRFATGRLVHGHVSWLDPHKVRRITVVGSQQMAIFDDVEPAEKLRIYDKGVDLVPKYRSYGDALTLRFGDIYVPQLEMEEPLRLECQHFVDSIERGTRPLSDGQNGLEVLRVLDGLQRSLENRGSLVQL